MSEAVSLIFRFWHLGDIVRAGDSQHLIEEAIYLRSFRPSTCRPMTCSG
jgi:hypothetical protein